MNTVGAVEHHLIDGKTKQAVHVKVVLAVGVVKDEKVELRVILQKTSR